MHFGATLKNIAKLSPSKTTITLQSRCILPSYKPSLLKDDVMWCPHTSPFWHSAACINPRFRSHLLSIGPMSMLNNVIPETTMNLSSFSESQSGPNMIQRKRCWPWRLNVQTQSSVRVCDVCVPLPMDWCVYCKQIGWCTKSNSIWYFNIVSTPLKTNISPENWWLED